MRFRYPRKTHPTPVGMYIFVRDGTSDLGGGYMELSNSHVCPLEVMLDSYGPNLTMMAFALKTYLFSSVTKVTAVLSMQSSTEHPTKLTMELAGK